jgi:hypothetical protein
MGSIDSSAMPGLLNEMAIKRVPPYFYMEAARQTGLEIVGFGSTFQTVRREEP